MKKKVSLKDVAKEVGVSTALVSYVINNRDKEARVGKDIAKKIREAVLRLDYQTNQIAKSLKIGKSQIFGCIVADISNPFFANIARTIEDEAKRNNYTVIFGSSDENEAKSWDLINVLLKQQVDGFIIAPAENSEKQIEYLSNQNIPYVLIDRHFPEINSNYVITDNYNASYKAVKHLLAKGRKHVAMLAYKSTLLHMQERKRGYTDAIKELSADPDRLVIKEVGVLNSRADIETAMNEMLHDNKTDAIFFATNTLSVSGLNFLNKSKYKVPKHIDVVCFDDSEVFDFFYSPITFIEQPLFQVGKVAVSILIEQIRANSENKKQVVLESELKGKRCSPKVRSY